MKPEWRRQRQKRTRRKHRLAEREALQQQVFGPVVTTKRVRQHNLRCLGKTLLYLAGVAMGTVAMAALWTWAWGLLFPAQGFGLGLTTTTVLFWFVLRRQKWPEGENKWELVAVDREVDPITQASQRMSARSPMVEKGAELFFTIVPLWGTLAVENVRAVRLLSDHDLATLEELRRQLSGRNDWVEVSAFGRLESQLFTLALLDCLAVRKVVGRWWMRVTLEGRAGREFYLGDPASVDPVKDD